MSKMMKLLNKVTDPAGGASFSIHGQSVASHHVQENFDRSEEVSEIKQNTRHQNVIVNFSLVFMAFVAMIAVSSILMSYKVFTQMNLSRDMSQQMMAAYGKQGDKITDLEKTLIKMESNQRDQINDLKSQLAQLNNNIKDSQSSALKISAEVDHLKTNIEDIKASHKLIVNKFKEMNTVVQGLQSVTAN